MEQKLEPCAGIEIADATLSSEADVSLDDLGLMKRSDYGHLSAEDEDAEPSAG